jgi:hypothetical protein
MWTARWAIWILEPDVVTEPKGEAGQWPMTSRWPLAVPGHPAGEAQELASRVSGSRT